MVFKYKKSNLLFVFTVTMIVCIVSYIIIRNNTNTMQDKPEINTPKARLPKTSTANQKKSKEKPAGLLLADGKTEAPSFIEAATLNEACSLNLKGVNTNIEELNTLTNISIQQQEAIDKIFEKCNRWYEYWDSLSGESQKTMIKEIENNRGLESFFNLAIHKKDKSVFNDAKAIVATGGDGSPLSNSALSYLLQMDKGLILEIGKRLNIKNPIKVKSYLKSNIGNILSLYDCSNDPSSCSKNSFSLLHYCAYLEDSCNISYEQHIANMLSANHFSDIQQIVSIIQQLIEEGYFD